MAHSIQVFRGQGAVINDFDLIVLFIFLRDSSAPYLAAWEHSLRHYGPGVIDLALDGASDGDVQKFAAALRELRKRLSSFGERIPATLLNAQNITDGIVFVDYPVSHVVEAALRLERLVSTAV